MRNNIVAVALALSVMALWDGLKVVRKVVHNYSAIVQMLKNSQEQPSVDRSKIPSDLLVW